MAGSLCSLSRGAKRTGCPRALQLLRGEKTRSAAQFDACISKRLTTSYIPLMTVMPDDIFSLSYLIKPHVTHTNANAMRAALGPISSQVVRLEDGISATSSWFEGRQQRSWRERAFGLIARAMGVGLEGLTDQAKAILAEAEFEVALRRDSVNRMRYIYANTVSFLLIALRGSSSRPLKLRFLESVQSARDS